MSHSMGYFPRPFDAVRRIDEIRDADAEVLFDDHHLPFGHLLAVDQDVHRLARQLLELHHRSALEVQDLADQHVRASELDGHRQGQVQQHFHLAVGLGRRRDGIQGLELGALDLERRGLGFLKAGAGFLFQLRIRAWRLTLRLVFRLGNA